MTRTATEPAPVAADRAESQPVLVGPSWRRGDDGAFVLPEHTLGWQVLGWTAEYLLQPDGPAAGEPWRFTPEQARWVLWWYALDQQGRFLYRSGVLRRMKGWGKDPLAAALCLVEFVGPCRFGGWAADGTPLAEPHRAAWVQTAAVAQSQTKNTTSLFPAMLSKRAIEEYRIDLGKEISYAHKGWVRLEAVTSSPKALEGARTSFSLQNETHWWLANNEGHEMADVIARNAAKSRDGSARVLSITNAHNPGENSVGERDWDAWQRIAAGTSRATGLLYDSLEAPADTVLADPESLRVGLRAARGDSVWVDIDRLVEEIYDPRTTPSTGRRWYLNQIIAAEDAWIAPHEWEQTARPGYTVADGAEITLGFDGSKSGDHTALVGCESESGHLFTLGIWDPEDYGGEVPREQVVEAVAAAFLRYDVVGFFSDVHPWESYIDRWAEEYGEGLCVRAGPRHVIGWDMRSNQKELTGAVEAFHDAVLERTLTHDGDVRATAHVANARRRPNRYGVSFGKEHRESTRKVDWLAAAVLARHCRQEYAALPAGRRRSKGGGWSITYV